MIKFKNPKNISAPVGPYMHQAEITGNVRWLIVSGQIGSDIKSNIDEDPIKQLEIALDNIILNLESANMSIKNLVKITFYFACDIDANERRKIINKKLDDHLPCMTMLFVKSLASPSLKVEVEAMACSDN